MQFSCNQDTFSKYLNIVSRVVASKPGLPILNNVLFKTEKGKLSMKATDLEMGVKCWIGAQVGAEGEITVPAKQLSELISTVSTEKIDATLKDNRLEVNAGKNSASFNTTTPEDFPDIGTLSKEKPLLRIYRDDLVEAINKVSFACAKDNIKPVLTGIKIEIEEDVIVFVGTDGMRLSRYVVRLSENINDNLTFLVPSKAFVELARIVTEFSEEDVEKDYIDLYLLEDQNQVLFRFNEIDLISRLIDGQYPDYKAIIPSAHQTQCEFKKTDIQESLKIVNIIARNVIGNKLQLSVKSDEGEIELSASQTDVGSNSSVFKVECEGESLDIGFSGKFLSELISNLDEEDLVFESTNSELPGVFKLKNDDSYIHLIMPMRL